MCRRLRWLSGKLPSGQTYVRSDLHARDPGLATRSACSPSATTDTSAASFLAPPSRKECGDQPKNGTSSAVGPKRGLSVPRPADWGEFPDTTCPTRGLACCGGCGCCPDSGPLALIPSGSVRRGRRCLAGAPKGGDVRREQVAARNAVPRPTRCRAATLQPRVGRASRR